MKKLYTLIFALLVSTSFSQAFFGTYDFVGITSVPPASPTNGLIDPTPVPMATGVTFGGFSAVISTTVVTPPAGSTGAGRFSYLNQPTGATTAIDTYSTLTGTLDPLIYYQVTLTPQAGVPLNLNQLTFKSQRSSTGVRTFAVRSSIDNFVTNLPASVTSTSASVQPGNIFFVLSDANTTATNISTGNTITLNNVGLTTPITFRFYGWNAESTGGSFSIDDVVISGSSGTLATTQNQISGLKVYISNNNLNITSDSNETKSVSVYNVLGKQVINTTTTGNPINVSDLSSGIYIVKVTENGKSNTVKVVIQ
jgi:Secretion system C-terminal sorting domain